MTDLLQYRHWAIAESIFQATAPRVLEALTAGHGLGLIFKQHTIEDQIPRLQSLLNLEAADSQVKISVDPTSRLPIVNSGNKRIALIPIVGGLTKYMGFCGEPGMLQMQSMILSANLSEGIDGIVLVMDSPGGTVDGTPEFGLTVRESPKPIGVFGDGMVASAALWIASQAKVIVGNKNNPTEFGSIGTLMFMPNYQNVMDAGRMATWEIIRAPQSVDKARINAVEKLDESTRKELQGQLKAITDEFIAAVKSGRGDRLDTSLEGLFTGRMFDAATSKKRGIIDHVGTLQTAVTKVAELARQQQKEGTNSQTNKSANTMKFPKLSALLAVVFGKGKDVNMKLTSDGPQSEDTASLEAAESKAAEMEAETIRLKADNETQATKIAGLEAKITSLETEKSTLVSEKAELQKKLDEKPAGQATTVIPTDDKSKSKFRSSADDESDKYVEAAGFKKD